jgi:hypothetical protein
VGRTATLPNVYVYQPLSRKKLEAEEKEEETADTIPKLFRTLRAKVKRLTLTK